MLVSVYLYMLESVYKHMLVSVCIRMPTFPENIKSFNQCVCTLTYTNIYTYIHTFIHTWSQAELAIARTDGILETLSYLLRTGSDSVRQEV
jgi:hypothetical protein